MEFQYPHGAFKEQHFPALVKAIKNSVERHDFDSGWTAVPNDKTFQHGLGVIPSIVRVQTSDEPDGTDFVNDSWTAIDRFKIVVAGTKKYTRCLLNK